MSVDEITHRELAQAVETGHFRADLYHRLSMFRVLLPPLRDRSDLQGLLTQLYARLVARHELGPRPLSNDVMISPVALYDCGISVSSEVRLSNGYEFK
jgi:transcriptional regulator of acetoin/glycerol metabolism